MNVYYLDWFRASRTNVAATTDSGAAFAQPPVGSVSYTGRQPLAFAEADAPAIGPGNAYLDRFVSYQRNVVRLESYAKRWYVTVNVPTGSYGYSGIAPQISGSQNQAIEIPATAIAYTGHIPTVSAANAVSVSVPLATVSYTGLVPAASANANLSIEVSTGSISYSGFVPTAAVTVNTAVRPPAGSYGYTGYAPIFVTAGGAITTIPRATVTYIGFEPTTAASQQSGPLARQYRRVVR